MIESNNEYILVSAEKLSKLKHDLEKLKRIADYYIRELLDTISESGNKTRTE